MNSSTNCAFGIFAFRKTIHILPAWCNMTLNNILNSF
jgi:hypothetical protein